MRAFIFGWLITIFVLPPFSAHAALGSNSASVQDDVTRMKGQLQVHEAIGYTVHAIQQTSGTVVRKRSVRAHRPSRCSMVGVLA